MGADGSGIVIPPDVARRVNAARDEGKPLALSYIAPDGFPVLSLRGSVHVHGDGQLALWARHADGDFVRAIRANPKVALLYRDNDDRTTFTFAGRAWVSEDESVRDRVYSESPKGERDHDLDRKGAAVVIDLQHVEGGTVSVRGPQVVERASEDTKIWSQLYRQV